MFPGRWVGPRLRFLRRNAGTGTPGLLPATIEPGRDGERRPSWTACLFAGNIVSISFPPANLAGCPRPGPRVNGRGWMNPPGPGETGQRIGCGWRCGRGLRGRGSARGGRRVDTLHFGQRQKRPGWADAQTAGRGATCCSRTALHSRETTRAPLSRVTTGAGRTRQGQWLDIYSDGGKWPEIGVFVTDGARDAGCSAARRRRRPGGNRRLRDRLLRAWRRAAAGPGPAGRVAAAWPAARRRTRGGPGLGSPCAGSVSRTLLFRDSHYPAFRSW